MAGNNEKYIIKTPSVNFDRNCGGIGNVLYKVMKVHSGKIFQTDSKSGETETYECFLNRCVRTAIRLHEIGVKKGDIVPIICYMDMDCKVPLFACFFIGALPCPLSKNLDNLDSLLKNLSPKVVFVSDEAIDKVTASLIHTEVVILGASNNNKSLKRFLSSIPDKQLDDFNPIFIEDLREKALILFSSGTSGTPKGAFLNHLGFVGSRSPQAWLTKNGKELDLIMLSQLPNQNQLVYSPLYWVTGTRCCAFFAMYGCNTINTYEHFDPMEAWELIHRFKVNLMFCFPSYVMDMYNCGKPDKVDASSLRLIFSGGMPLPPKYVHGLEEMLPGTIVANGYGSTEAGDLAVWELENHEHIKMKKVKPTSVGVFVVGKLFKVVDPYTEITVGPNQTGELRVKGEDIFVGLYNGNYSECFDNGGWYKTGDLVYYDEDNCLYIVDRIKESFKYLSTFVYPSDIEKVLITHPFVRDCLVFGKPHEDDGYHPTALVVLKEDFTNITEEQIVNFVNERVKQTNKIRGGVKFVKSIPRTETGKKLRRMAREVFESETQQICSHIHVSA